jgi:hypothetical protein
MTSGMDSNLGDCRIVPLGRHCAQLQGTLATDSWRRLRLTMEAPLKPGVLVQVETADRIWLGEISWCAPEGDHYAAWVEVEHRSTAESIPAPAARGRKPEMEAGRHAAVVLILLRGLRLLAVKADPAGFREFQAEMERLEQRLQDEADCDIEAIAIEALDLLEHYNERVAGVFLGRISEIEDALGTLTRATSRGPLKAPIVRLRREDF